MKTLVVGIKWIAIFNNIPKLSNKLGMCDFANFTNKTRLLYIKLTIFFDLFTIIWNN